MKKQPPSLHSTMTRNQVQSLLKEIGMTGVEFSTSLGKAKNFVTDMKRFGVPLYVDIILTLAVEHKRLGGDPKEILNRYVNQVTTLDKGIEKE